MTVSFSDERKKQVWIKVWFQVNKRMNCVIKLLQREERR